LGKEKRREGKRVRDKTSLLISSISALLRKRLPGEKGGKVSKGKGGRRKKD